MRRSYILVAIALAGLAAVWGFSLAPRWTRRVARNDVFSAHYVGTQTNADPQTNIVPVHDALSTYERTVVVKDAADWPRSLVLEDKYSARNIETGMVDFEFITTEKIDPETGAWAEGPYKGEIVLFPRNVQRHDYTMRSSYIPGLPLKFTGVRDIGGLETYLFSYKGPIEYAAAFVGTPETPGIKLLPGQDIRCADDNFYYRIWVEPRTGSQVQVEEGCLSGDYVYDKATGNKVFEVDRWNGVSAGSNLSSSITEIYSARRTYLLALYLPVILVMGSLGVLVVGGLRRNTPAIA
jgi:hypothetical protein